jgi:hypothetical protein
VEEVAPSSLTAAFSDPVALPTVGATTASIEIVAVAVVMEPPKQSGASKAARVPAWAVLAVAFLSGGY